MSNHLLTLWNAFVERGLPITGSITAQLSAPTPVTESTPR